MTVVLAAPGDAMPHSTNPAIALRHASKLTGTAACSAITACMAPSAVRALQGVSPSAYSHGGLTSRIQPDVDPVKPSQASALVRSASEGPNLSAAGAAAPASRAAAIPATPASPSAASPSSAPTF
jgi:hypothetical protein